MKVEIKTIDDVKIWLEACMAGESHTQWKKGYWSACKELYDMLEEGEE